MTPKQRIDYIDLAKGLCILLVISNHIDLGEFLYKNEHVSSFFFSFRMPLYYMLSGLFLSIKDNNYFDFVQKKINRLIVPFVFFVTITNIYSFIKHTITHSDFIYSSPLLFLFRENSYGLMNNPLWFLFSLFTTYMLYAALHYLFHGKKTYIYAGTVLCGCIGYFLGKMHINIPFYLDTSLTCLPFVTMGSIIRNETNLLYGKMSKSFCIGSAAILFLITFFLCGDTGSIFTLNSYDCNILSLFVTGILGSTSILLICKAINKLLIISYMGRYSIIVLGVHDIFRIEFGALIREYITNVIIYEFILMFIVVVLSLLSIYILKRFFPCFVAQKDFIYFNR